MGGDPKGRPPPSQNRLRMTTITGTTHQWHDPQFTRPGATRRGFTLKVIRAGLRERVFPAQTAQHSQFCVNAAGSWGWLSGFPPWFAPTGTTPTETSATVPANPTAGNDNRYRLIAWGWESFTVARCAQPSKNQAWRQRATPSGCSRRSFESDPEQTQR